MKIQDIKYIDCHSHPHDVKYKREGVNVDEVLRKLKDDGGATIVIGTDFALSVEALELAKKHDNVWCTIGVHPADNHKEEFDCRFEELYIKSKEKIVGVGECGLDYYYFEKTFGIDWKESDDCKKEIERQKILFRKQIEFASKHDLPLVIHGRPSKNSMDAYRDILDILEEHTDYTRAPGAGIRGHAHFFVGNLEIAKRFLDLGFLMSFDGPITFTKEYDEVVKFLPIDKIMIETDSPYASPVPYRGQICYPFYVVEVAKKIAELKKMSTEEVLEITKNNADKLFSLNKK
jgi:TatD DNase family protein